MAKDLQKLVLLHSNDMHGDFLAEEVDKKLVGGVSRLSAYINKVREEEPNTIYCVAGDMFRGSVLDSEFKGISTIQIMNALGPDVVTIGNHETDYGLAHLLFIEKCATFPLVNANMYIKTNGTRLFKPCKVINVGEGKRRIKVLFIGILTEQVIAQTKKDGLIGTMVSIEDAAAEVGKICNSYNAIDIDLTVLLTHIGWEEDHALAELLDPSWGVDMIIGGHSHTFIEQPDIVNGVLIAQAGVGTDQLGRFDIMIDMEKNCVDSWKWQPVPIDDEHCPDTDPVVEGIIAGIKSQTDVKYGRIVTRFKRKLTHPKREQETELGDLSADILKESLGTDIALFGSGSIRSSQLGPVVTYQNLVECFPYAAKVWEVKMTGAQLKRAWVRINRDEALAGGHTEYYQLSKGCHMVYSKGKHEVTEFTLNGEPLVDDQVYSVALQDFHYNNLEDGLDITLEELKKNGTPRIICTSDQEVLEEYLASHPLLTRRIEKRIVITE
ncbi:MAG: bifunctional metallophosphatase/5'-nucleotidase [Eggerthellaceae bacterium]|nr:bifunctional metallophosphatase/5'-nucleotidase [Eggerthellaceae bacterium]